LKSPEVIWHQAHVTRQMRERRNSHRSLVVWFTGLSGSGKSTIAHEIERQLFEKGVNPYVFDGDNIRHGLCGNLDFSRQHRQENIRRIAHVARLFVDAGFVVLPAFITPFAEDRMMARDIIGTEDFIECYCKCPLEVCEQRDVKGLYKKARSGQLQGYTGVTSPYEEPLQPEIVLDTAMQSIAESSAIVISFLTKRLDLKLDGGSKN